MRGLRSFAGLLAILIALGAYLYFVESKRTPGDDAEKRDKVFTVDADTIEEVTIKSESGERTTLRKAGDEWQIVAPSAAPADRREISGITTNLSTLEQQRVVEENPSDLEEFGLAKPRIEVAFKAGGHEHRLLIGDKTPTGADLYARTGAQSRVFLVASFVESTFNRGTFDLRDKSALQFDREKADAVEIVTSGRTLKFARADGQWTIAQPQVSRVDAAAIEGLVSRLSGLQMKKVATEPDEKQYQLDKPQATVRVGVGSAQSTLVIGARTPDGDVYARDASKPTIFTVEGSLLDDLKKDAGEYRQKDIFDARAFNTTRVEITRAGETITLEKNGETWRQTTPAAKDADAAKVDALLSALTAARATSFADAAPAGASVAVTIAVRFDEGKEERVTFMRAGADAFATRADAKGAAKIDAATLDGILKAIDEAR